MNTFPNSELQSLLKNKETTVTIYKIIDMFKRMSQNLFLHSIVANKTEADTMRNPQKKAVRTAANELQNMDTNRLLVNDSKCTPAYDIYQNQENLANTNNRSKHY